MYHERIRLRWARPARGLEGAAAGLGLTRALAFSIPLLNALTVAPVLEEFLIRGAVFGNLLRGHSLRAANAVSALLFVLLHMPGWYFMGNLAENMTRPVGGALSILVLGLLFGYAAYRGKSVAGAMIAHFLNNVAA